MVAPPFYATPWTGELKVGEEKEVNIELGEPVDLQVFLEVDGGLSIPAQTQVLLQKLGNSSRVNTLPAASIRSVVSSSGIASFEGLAPGTYRISSAVNVNNVLYRGSARINVDEQHNEATLDLEESENGMPVFPGEMGG